MFKGKKLFLTEIYIGIPRYLSVVKNISGLISLLFIFQYNLYNLF